MKHVYCNDDGEIVVADTLEDAARYHDCQLGRHEKPLKGWTMIPCEAEITIMDESGEGEIKTASAWAAEYNSVLLISSTYG